VAGGGGVVAIKIPINFGLLWVFPFFFQGGALVIPPGIGGGGKTAIKTTGEIYGVLGPKVYFSKFIISGVDGWGSPPLPRPPQRGGGPFFRGPRVQWGFFPKKIKPSRGL